MPCPTPGCPETLKVRKDKNKRPTMMCDRCRFQAFVKSDHGARAWFGEKWPSEEAAGDPPPADAPNGKGVTPGTRSSAPGVTPEKKPADPPAKKKGEGWW
jgi:hypothetical protein